ILKWFEIKGVDLTEVTLHIGLASFRGIEVEDLSKHKMESENFYVSPEAAKIVNQGIQNKKRICAIGTSTLRAIESSVSTLSELLPIEGWTEKFIYPQYDFKIANALVTNFHAPKTPFYIATTAFGGLELIKKAYQVAIKENYKFLDYGDVMLII
ncbi:MAG: S-adenosylmethionine:tRNA ribosyltransferase-isomerase, partial [Bacteroidetes bacterium]|nr:S-adenosylmethionine:tRNA ribosyltransferase-isomerase [Bacteroidota bacterium]